MENIESTIQCEDAAPALLRAKDLVADLNLSLKEMAEGGSADRAKEIKYAIEIELDKLDPYRVMLRNEIAKKQNLEYVGVFNGKYAPATADGIHWYLVDKAGEKVFGGDKIEFIGEFHDNRALVREWITPEWDRGATAGVYCYFIDENLQRVGDYWRQARDYSEGVASVGGLEGWAYINKEGKPIFTQEVSGEVRSLFYASCSDFRKNVAKISDDVSYLVNRAGEKVQGPGDFGFDEVSSPIDGQAIGEIFVDGGEINYYLLRFKDGQGVHERLPCETKLLGEGFQARKYADGYWHLYDPANPDRQDFNKFAFHSIQPFSEGVAVAEIADEIGRGSSYINKNGVDITAGKYGDAKPFREGRARVFSSFYLKKDGSYMKVQFLKGTDFRGGVAQVQLSDGKYRFIDRFGRQIFKPRTTALNYKGQMYPTLE